MITHASKYCLRLFEEAPEIIEKMCADPKIADLCDQLRASSAEVQKIFDSYDSDLYRKRKAGLKELEKLCIINVREGISTPATRTIKKLVLLDGKEVGAGLGGYIATESHNAYAFRNIGGLSITPGITTKMKVDKRTVFKYMDKTRQRLMQLLFGFDGIEPGKINMSAVKPSRESDCLPDAEEPGEPVITATTQID